MDQTVQGEVATSLSRKVDTAVNFSKHPKPDRKNMTAVPTFEDSFTTPTDSHKVYCSQRNAILISSHQTNRKMEQGIQHTRDIDGTNLAGSISTMAPVPRNRVVRSLDYPVHSLRAPRNEPPNRFGDRLLQSLVENDATGYTQNENEDTGFGQVVAQTLRKFKRVSGG